MDENNPYESPQAVEEQAQQEPLLAAYGGDAVPADFTIGDLLMVLGMTGLMILVALAVPYVLATILGR